MSSPCCHNCKQQYGYCCCELTGIIPKDSISSESEEEKELRYKKFYEEIKALCFKYYEGFK